MLSRDLARALTIAAHVNQPVIIWGPPGGGKTTLARTVAKATGRKFILQALSQVDVVDIRGILTVQDGVARYALPAWLPTAQTGPSLIVFDDMTQAPVSVMNGVSELLCDRTLGGEDTYKLPANAAMVATANRRADRAGTNEMPTHIRNRLVHLTLTTSVEDTVGFETDPNYLRVEPITMEPPTKAHPMVMAFLRFRSDLLDTFDPLKSTDPAFASRRSWGFVSKLLPFIENDPALLGPMVCGSVGEAAGTEFVAFMQLLTSIPDWRLVFADPKTAPIPEEPSMQYAFLAQVVRHVTLKNAQAFCAYLNRLSQDIAAAAVQDLKYLHAADGGAKPFLLNPEGNKFCTNNLQLIVG